MGVERDEKEEEEREREDRFPLSQINGGKGMCECGGKETTISIQPDKVRA